LTTLRPFADNGDSQWFFHNNEGNMQKQYITAIILLTFSFAFAGKTVHADCVPNPCDTACQTKESYFCEKSVFESPVFENRLIGKKSKSRIQVYGWMLTGITVNNHGATQKYGDSVNYEWNNRRNSEGNITRPGMTDQSGNTYVLQIEQPSDWKVNQLWFGAKRELDNRFGWGFQADFCYGTDARYARNWGDRTFDYTWGSGDYFAAFSQLFATVGTKDLFVKVGKFGGGFSYEGLAAPREFFYSHANICYGRPLVTEGVMVEWHPNKKWILTGGWLEGFFNSFGDPYGDNSFLGKATYNLTKDVALSYRIFYNDRGARSDTNIGQIDCLNTLILTWQLNKNWFYMGEVAFTDGKHYSPAGRTGSDAWGINNHLIRTLNEKLSVGFRGEYHYSHGSTFDNRNVTGGEGGDIWTYTLAAHYKINPKTTFRPEIRYDYADYKNGFRPFGGDESKSDQLCGGVSFIVMF
jgi:hypothetical protein